MSEQVLGDHDYERLLEFRTALRRFLKWSTTEAAKAGLPPMQHQLLLAIRGHPDRSRGPTISEVSEYLLIRPNSAAELVARAEDAGLVTRMPDSDDGRAVRLRLSRLGIAKLAEISHATVQELRQIVPEIVGVWKDL